MCKKKLYQYIQITLCGVVVFLMGCETEQSASEKNDAVVGYAQEIAKSQAEFANQEQLKKLDDN